MKVVFVCSEFHLGGVFTSFCSLVNFVFKTDTEIELHLINQKCALPIGIPSKVKVIKVVGLYEEFFSYTFKGNMVRMIKNGDVLNAILLFIVRFFQLFGINKTYLMGNVLYPYSKKNIADVCIVLKENDRCLYYALSKIDSKHYISFFHTAAYYEKEYKSIYESSMIDDIITVSDGNRQFLIGNMPGIRSKIHVVHNIVNPVEIEQKAREFKPSFSVEFRNIVSVGRICTEKGIECIMQAGKLLSEHCDKVKWYLIGPFDKDYTEEKLNSYFHIHNLTDIFVVVGPKNNPFPYIVNADIVVNPSQIESFGMVIREAQILSVPVIATKTFGAEELIDDGNTGLLIDIDDSESLCHSIMKLLSDTVFYNKIKTNMSNINYNEIDIIKEDFNNIISNYA